MTDRSCRVVERRPQAAAWLAGLLLAPMLCWPALASVATAPAPPCATGAAAVSPPFADPPNVRIWHRRDFGNWQPPACFGWPPLPFTLVTVLSAQFKFDGGADDLLARFGAASAWKGIRYWSSSDGSWETFITDSAALDDAKHRRRRPDFTPTELKTGADFYFLRSDNSTSEPVIYRMRVAEAGTDRLVVTIGNVSPVSRLVFTLFASGDIQSTYFLEKIGPGLWSYYALTLLREGMMVIGNHDESYSTRNVAIYRYLAGIPTDQEPPLTP